MIEDLVEQFATLHDPRCARKVAHRLVDVLVIAVCAAVAGAESFEDVALYGRCKEPWLRGFLELPGGVPSHDTFHRVLMLIDPDAFEQRFLAWVRGAFPAAVATEDSRAAAAGEQIAVDGKTLRRSFDRTHGRSPLHVVTAYATARGLVLAQRAVDDKGGEPAVLPALLDGPPLTAAASALTPCPAGARSPRRSPRAAPTPCSRSRATRGARTPRSRPGSPSTRSTAGRTSAPASTPSMPRTGG